MKNEHDYHLQNRLQSLNPKKKVHKNQQNDYNYQQTQSKQKKTQYILDPKLAQSMLMDNQLFQHFINRTKIYFPYTKLNKPQQKFIRTVFQCLETNQNLLIQSPTGTGKTLSLLVSTLSWEDQHYKNSQNGIYDDRIKIIYTSRAHSQLSQISKQLEKTPYRPQMILFGSRQKMCINEEVIKQMQSNDDKSYGGWSHKCNIAVRQKQQYLKSRFTYEKNMKQNQQLVQNLRSKSSRSTKQIQQLIMAQENLRILNSKCDYYHKYDSGADIRFNKDIGRQILNSQQLKTLAKNHKICPYYYPKRVKNRGTLYLMPYNYLLDSRILQYSAGFLENSIIIFDQGHNVPKTACQGYSINFSQNVLQGAKRSLTDKLTDKDFDADQVQMQNIIRHKEQSFEEKYESDEEMEGLLKQIIKRENINQNQKQIQPQDLKAHQQFLINVINNAIGNFKNFFNSQKQSDFKKADAGFLDTIDVDKPIKIKKTYNWQAVRFLCTSQRQKIQNLIKQIFFSQIIDRFKNKSLKQKLESIVQSLNYTIKYFMKKSKHCYKLINMIRFYQRIQNVLYNKDYFDKFYLQITQSRRYDSKQHQNTYKGQITIQCLTPQFSFQKLSNIKPHSIIITSGTLSPMNVFADQIGLKFMHVQVGHVITEQNIMVRKITKNLRGEQLKIDSLFYSGKNGLQFANLEGLFKLLIKTLSTIPDGVLVIVSSFSCLRYLQNFYKHQRSRQIRQQFEQVKPHIYFQPKKNLEATMDRFNTQSQQGKGAVLFCVCRAKLSEGIDFKDKLCRSVIFLGIPYVNKGNAFIQEKGHYLKKIKSPYSSQWKFIQASKAINQGLGRTVRHAKDYGSILLFDIRYDKLNRDSTPVVSNISEWIKKNWRQNSDIEVLQKELKQFYQKCEKLFPLDSNKVELQQGQLTLQYFKNKNK